MDFLNGLTSKLIGNTFRVVSNPFLRMQPSARPQIAFIHFLKILPKDLAFSVNIIKALYFLSQYKPNLDNLAFLNEENVGIFVEAFNSQMYFPSKKQESQAAVATLLKNLPNLEAPPLRLHLESNFLNQNNKRPRADEVSTVVKKQESSLAPN
jgi:hypothetical protein